MGKVYKDEVCPGLNRVIPSEMCLRLGRNSKGGVCPRLSRIGTVSNVSTVK